MKSGGSVQGRKPAVSGARAAAGVAPQLSKPLQAVQGKRFCNL